MGTGGHSGTDSGVGWYPTTRDARMLHPYKLCHIPGAPVMLQMQFPDIWEQPLRIVLEKGVENRGET